MDKREIFYLGLFDLLKDALNDQLETVKEELYATEDKKFKQWTLENNPYVFLRVELVPDFVNPSRTFTTAILMEINSIFRAIVNFYLEDHNFTLYLYEGILPPIGNSQVSVSEACDIAVGLAKKFVDVIKNKDKLLSEFFKKAKVIQDEVEFKSEDIFTPWGKQKFRFAIYKENDKAKVLFDDIFGQNLTSVTNAIEYLAYHITRKYFEGDYKNIEWFQIFCFNPKTIVSKIELEPYIEERRKALIFKERKLKGYSSPEFVPVVSFLMPEATSIVKQFLGALEE